MNKVGIAVVNSTDSFVEYIRGIIPECKIYKINDGLYRFIEVNENSQEFVDIELLYIMDANIKINNINEIIPAKRDNIVTIETPTPFFEVSTSSSSFISSGSRSKSYCGAFVGGYRDNFLHVCEQVAKLIDLDDFNELFIINPEVSYLTRYLYYILDRVQIAKDVIYTPQPAMLTAGELTTVKVCGGIGNQLFQISTAYAYAHDNGKKLILDWTMNKEFGRKKSYKSSIIRKIERQPVYRLYKFVDLHENSFRYNPLPNMKGNVNLIGWFQSEKYFEKYKGEIEKLFEPNKIYKEYVSFLYGKLRKDYGDVKIIGLHVRHGDVTEPPHKGCYYLLDPENYYIRAVKILESIIPEKKLYLLFSDNFEWCLKQKFFTDMKNLVCIDDKFKGYAKLRLSRYKIYDDDILDLYMLANCDHYVISNSSFCWWATYLGKSENKTVIAPSEWFDWGHVNNGTVGDDVYMSHWKIINLDRKCHPYTKNGFIG